MILVPIKFIVPGMAVRIELLVNTEIEVWRVTKSKTLKKGFWYLELICGSNTIKLELTDSCLIEMLP